MNHVPDLAESLPRPRTVDLLWKRGFDLSVAAVALIVLSPLMLAAALAIKLTSPGPVLYLQPRRGKDGQVFNVFKLRTLKYDRCDAPDTRDVKAVGDHDLRVFPVGRFLRQRGLDEIPQLWNVLRGEMSIVGPRPHALPHDDLFLMNVPGYAHRYTVKPGITGWAQVNGSRGSIHSFEDAGRRVRLDREYIRTRSLFLDIVVTFRTFSILAKGIDAKEARAPEMLSRTQSATARLNAARCDRDRGLESAAGSPRSRGTRSATAVLRKSLRAWASGGARDAFHAGLGVVDQGVTALGSLIPVVLLGRMAGAAELGVFSLAVSTALFAAIASQSLFLSGYPIFRAQAPSASALHTFHVVLFGVAMQAALIPVYLGLLHWTSRGGALDASASLAAIAFVVATTLRSYLRSVSLARRDLPKVLALDSLALVILSSLLAWLVMRGIVTVWNVFLVLAVANAIFAVAWSASYATRMAVSLSGAWRYLGRSVAFGRWALLGVGFGSMPYYLTPWLLGFVRGTEAIAVYAAASTVVGLANHGFIGLTRGIEARTAEAFHQGGVAALQESLRRTMWIVLPGLSAIVVVVWIAADFFGEVVLPSHAQETGAVARILSLALLAGSVRVLAGNALWAMSLPRATIPADLTRGVVSIGAGMLGAYYAGAVGCAMAVLLGDAISSVIVVVRYTAETRRRTA